MKGENCSANYMLLKGILILLYRSNVSLSDVMHYIEVGDSAPITSYVRQINDEL